MAKKLLDESNAKWIDEDVYLDTAIPSEEIIPEVSPEQLTGAITGLINDIVKDEFSLIEKITGTIATIESEQIENKDDILTILKTILDEKNINVGMLTKALELVDSKSTELMNAGIEKAEEVISEPASTDLE